MNYNLPPSPSTIARKWVATGKEADRLTDLCSLHMLLQTQQKKMQETTHTQSEQDNMLAQIALTRAKIHALEAVMF
jgi:hypothetical protein